jgi:glycosyltransferase involved in cell wall biosynthesis
MPIGVCCLDDEGAWAHELRDIGVEVAALCRTPGFHPSLASKIASFARRRRATVLHCHQYSPFVYGQLASVAMRTRTIYTEHGRASDAPPTPKQRAVNPIFGLLPSAICSVSQNLKEFMVRAGFPDRRIRVIYNGIRIGPVPGPLERTVAREWLGLGPSEFVIGTVGRLDAVKDIPTLVHAFARAADGIRAARLVVIGDGPDRPAIERAAEATGVRAAVHLTGYRDDVRAVLPALDVYANASITEGVSLTILEAMAAKIPVIATNVGGTPEVVKDGETGALVAPRDAGGLSHALRFLYATPATRVQWGNAGRERVERMFQLREMVDAYTSLYHG